MRAEELLLIESAAADPTSREFEILMATFDLSESYRECLISVLGAHTWETSQKPLSALRRKVLSAVFSRRGRRDRPQAVALGLSEAAMSFAHLRNAEAFPVRELDGVWRSGRGLDPYCEERASTIPLSFRLRESRGKPIDWRTIADSLDHAGLDELEMAFVMCYLGQKRARARFVADQGSDESARRAALAAVKRVQRKMPKIRRALLNE